MAGNGLTPAQLAQDRAAENEHRAEKLQRRHALMQQKRREEECRNRVGIAEQRDGRGRQPLQAREVQKVGKGGVDKPYERDIRQLCPDGTGKPRTICQ